MLFFFFQAEDGIRDLYVTGVQTCALPISVHPDPGAQRPCGLSLLRPVRPRLRRACELLEHVSDDSADRKSTRLNSSHVEISYAVFCLKKKKSMYSTNSCSTVSLASS